MNFCADTTFERDTRRPLNALLQLKACFWSGSVNPLRSHAESPVPDELAEFESGSTDWFQGVYPSDLETVRQNCLAAAQGISCQPFEYRMVTEKRGIVWVRHWLIDSESGGKPGNGEGLAGFVQVFDECKHLEAECLRICEREKSAMGQELHDDVCQLLAGLACMLEVIGQKAKTAMPEMNSTFKELGTLLNAGMDRTRSLAHSLVPLRLVNMGLGRALRELASQTKRNFNIHVDAKVSRNLPLHPPEQILHLYRVAQEAISNAIKHGKATEITLELTRQRNKMNLTIRDNGSGIPQDSSRRQGIGLHIMRYRAGALGGRFNIAPHASRGSVVTVSYDCAAAPKKFSKASA